MHISPRNTTAEIFLMLLQGCVVFLQPAEFLTANKDLVSNCFLLDCALFTEHLNTANTEFQLHTFYTFPLYPPTAFKQFSNAMKCSSFQSEHSHVKFYGTMIQSFLTFNIPL